LSPEKDKGIAVAGARGVTMKGRGEVLNKGICRREKRRKRKNVLSTEPSPKRGSPSGERSGGGTPKTLEAVRCINDPGILPTSHGETLGMAYLYQLTGSRIFLISGERTPPATKVY